jgi:hypothetical protein
VVQPCREHRGGATVVLGRAEDDDRVGRSLLIAGTLVDDAVCGVDPDDGRRRDPEQEQPDEGAHRSGRAQRPWHFLYFAPDPHQHGSLRPIRAPAGV